MLISPQERAERLLTIVKPGGDLRTVIAAAIADAERDLLLWGAGEPPVSAEREAEARKLRTFAIAMPAAGQLLALLDHARAETAFIRREEGIEERIEQARAEGERKGRKEMKADIMSTILDEDRGQDRGWDRSALEIIHAVESVPEEKP